MQWKVADGGNGHGYAQVVLNVPVSWAAGRALVAALADGSPLATITSESENSFVAGVCDDPAGTVVIGGYQPSGAEDPDGGWAWVTGEAFASTRWQPGEPNDQGAKEYIDLETAPGHPEYPMWNDTPVFGINFAAEISQTGGEMTTRADFTPGHDLIDLVGFGDFDEVAARLDAADDGTWLRLGEVGGPDVLLEGVNVLTLDAGEFLL